VIGQGSVKGVETKENGAMVATRGARID